MSPLINNKVTNSGIITLDLANYIPNQVLDFKLKPLLYQGMILREKEFRESLKKVDFSIYKDQEVCITNTDNAIIPMWAYMLISTYLTPFTNKQFIGNKEEALRHFTVQAVSEIPLDKFVDKRIVIKGCSEKAISELAYLSITKHLFPHVKSIMYGEPCSTVPIFKKSQIKK